jgi:uncharacterized membrane protein YtjA (UPF0391 family)
MYAAGLEPARLFAVHAKPAHFLEERATARSGEPHMLKWAIIFLVISLIAGALGFSGVARGAATIAKVLFGIFLILFIIFIILAVTAVGVVT